MPTAIASKTEQAQELIRDLLSRNQPSCVTSSFQTECMVLVHLLIQQKPDIPVLFLETGYHFAETYKYRDEMTQRYGLRLTNLIPKITVAEQESQLGSSTRLSRRSAAESAKSSRSSPDSIRTTPGSPPCAATSPRPAPTSRKWTSSSSPPGNC